MASWRGWKYSFFHIIVAAQRRKSSITEILFRNGTSLLIGVLSPPLKFLIWSVLLWKRRFIWRSPLLAQTNLLALMVSLLNFLSSSGLPLNSTWCVWYMIFTHMGLLMLNWVRLTFFWFLRKWILNLFQTSSLLVSFLVLIRLWSDSIESS